MYRLYGTKEKRIPEKESLEISYNGHLSVYHWDFSTRQIGLHDSLYIHNVDF